MKNVQHDRQTSSETQVLESKGYRLIPRCAAQVLSPEQLYCYYVLVTLSDYQTHRSNVLEDTLVAYTGYSQSSISKWVNAMKKIGLIDIKCEYGAGGVAHKKKNYYYVPAPKKDFIIVSTSLRDEDWEPLTRKKQSTLKGFLLMLKCCCLNNCNDTLYSINEMVEHINVGRDKAQTLMRLLKEKNFAEPLAHRFTGYRILGSWFDKGNTYRFPQGTLQICKDIYNDIMTYCHEQGYECPPYEKHYIGNIATKFTFEHKTLFNSGLAPDFIRQNSVLHQLRQRLPSMKDAPQSLAYFTQVLMGSTYKLPLKSERITVQA